jgi:hypothetical protein
MALGRQERSFAPVAISAAGAVVLFALGAVIVLVNRLSACGGSGGSLDALPGSAQRGYCEANLDLIALGSPLPMLVALAVFSSDRHARWLALGFVVGLLLAGTPILAAVALPDS